MMDGYNKEAIFHLAGVFMHYPLYSKLLEEIKANPDILKENVKIGSIYGSPCGIWNGGRTIIKEDLKNLEFIANVQQMMEKYNIPVRFTFTNCLLKEEHLSDAYCNALLKLFNNGNNEVTCNSELLENYIRSKYGDRYRYISSTTKRITDNDKQLEEINKDYHLVVVDYDYNKNFDFLNSIENKSKCELLCNSVCKPSCEMRCQHYKALSQAQLLNIACPFGCEYAVRPFYQVKNDATNGTFISAEDINDKYLPMGFENFKLEGRTNHPSDVVEILIYYIIKDKYALEIRQKLHACII